MPSATEAKGFSAVAAIACPIWRSGLRRFCSPRSTPHRDELTLAHPTKFELTFCEITLETKQRPRGRPRKKEGSIKPWEFARAAMVSCAYDEDRGRGEKHSVAVRQAVNYVRRFDSEMPISESVVKRILATYRPQNSETMLRFERSVRSEEDLQKNRWIREQLAASEPRAAVRHVRERLRSH